ncbi:putative MFS transporter [Thozetella sp. PMI_491]|nr:putative MFS transporter [Thozetella sp. PMI_491]
MANDGKDSTLGATSKLEFLECEDATAALNSQSHLPEYIRAMTPEQRRQAEKRLVRKIDLRLMPPIVVMYLLNYIDRNNIASAVLGGISDDLKLVGSQYQTCVSILFVGYILIQVPSNLLLNKIGRPALYLPGVMFCWGLVSAATAAAQSFGGLLALRFFLGFVEAPYFPGCLFYLSSWYTRKELALRTALLYSGSLLAGAFSGLISAGIVYGMDGLGGLRAWRWLFIIEGGVTTIIALLVIPILPNFPATTKWLTDEEKVLAIWRLEEEAGQQDSDPSASKQGFWLGLRLAILDSKTWVLMAILFCMIFSASVTNFFPSVVATLGYNQVTSLLLTVPPYALGLLTTCLGAWHADRTGERYLHVTLPLLLAVAAFVIAATTTSLAPHYLSMMLMISGIYPGFVVALGWISNTVTRPPAKRAAALALITAVGNSSSIYASYMFQSFMAPRYILAMTMCSVGLILAIVSASILRFQLCRLNGRLERGEHVEGVTRLGTDIGRDFRFLV